MKNDTITPFVKWAGGKRQLLPKIKELLPERFETYYEPFVGGGALLFELKKDGAIINDINLSLINAYTQIRDNVELFLEYINDLDARIINGNKEYYYYIRDLYNSKLFEKNFDTELASMFVFLNKHCFNGLYRVNSKGLFNVPYNKSIKPSVNRDNIIEISEYLKKITIMNGDFEDCCVDANEGDFIFFDSPYAPLNTSSFDSYTKEGFEIDEHIRLAELFDELTERGCFCMLTNHNTDLINNLYSNKGYNLEVVKVKRFINSDSSNRKGEEIIICNY
ncbi:Dam family site-specific DNA-(adenine-N6)-methyltransferase [Peptostreptococcus anaerobius]|uniref:site-specific DNA-methyltransferase (adenine-specific) n=1 Tax=Peptostreptococcus porci TaxID=2652282 RepID=A0A6N7WZH2_9FIRM|nr:Dam family site-specific DNA-(adenine-N6)-methyltransferase [Peptostreptococcus porci]MDY2794615.1 Dam family site-specific DNA-(adenine-N6)-methyltransferase [Peptostreptococcus porci]MST62090.1 Dam family site-specific DNA-(adenine-N6)-methyltransferase [Peptostreptococcus porci]